MDKNVVFVGLFLALVFGLTAVAHFTFVAGHSGEEAAVQVIHELEHSGEGTGHQEREITVYATQDECEQTTGSDCELQMCDNIPAGKSFEDICGEGFKKGWRPVEPQD